MAGFRERGENERKMDIIIGIHDDDLILCRKESVSKASSLM